jgi:hypothetical protein
MKPLISAATEFFQDAVMRNGLPEERLGVRHDAVILVCGFGIRSLLAFPEDQDVDCGIR